jgi:REP element-mobilizing transposase RayT
MLGMGCLGLLLETLEDMGRHELGSSRVVLDPNSGYNPAMSFLAYHITWGTYGTRLHGDPRMTVDRQHNKASTPFLGYDEERWEWCKERLKYPAVVLTREQMMFIEKAIPMLCERGCWGYRACAAGPDHVHVVLSSEHEPQSIRRVLKRWLGQEMSKHWALGQGEERTWWAEGGSIRCIDDPRYLQNAVQYVNRQRATGETV